MLLEQYFLRNAKKYRKYYRNPWNTKTRLRPKFRLTHLAYHFLLKKKDYLHEFQNKGCFLNIKPVDQTTKRAYQGLSSIIKVIGTVIVKVQSKR